MTDRLSLVNIALVNSQLTKRGNEMNLTHFIELS